VTFFEDIDGIAMSEQTTLPPSLRVHVQRYEIAQNWHCHRPQKIQAEKEDGA